MEKIFAKAQAQLASRASILLQIGMAKRLSTFTWASIGVFDFELDDLHLRFDKHKGHPYDAAELDAVIEELDARIFKAKKEAEAIVSLVNAWGA